MESVFPPTQVRVVSQEAINEREVRIMFEMIVDVHRLAEVSQIFLSHAVSQLSAKPAKP
jgi:hypothetical protein